MTQCWLLFSRGCGRPACCNTEVGQPAGGTQRGDRLVVLAFVLALAAELVGCRQFKQACYDALPMLVPKVVEVPVSNPSHIGPVDPEFLSLQIVDALDDYFRVANEQWVRRDNVQGALEGIYTTYPQVSGTSFEPWRGDATRGFERLQSTIQTIRRTATVRVNPEEAGYKIEVLVIKEQEDVDQAQNSTAGAAAQRHDGTIVRNENQQRQLPVTLGWYEVGRDQDLERRIMSGILGRVTEVEPPRKRILHH